jgi:hypothetical protein
VEKKGKGRRKARKGDEEGRNERREGHTLSHRGSKNKQLSRGQEKQLIGGQRTRWVGGREGGGRGT